MNIMIAAIGVDSGFELSGGGTQGTLFVSLFAAAGLVFLVAGACILHRCREPHASRYSAPRR